MPHSSLTYAAHISLDRTVIPRNIGIELHLPDTTDFPNKRVIRHKNSCGFQVVAGEYDVGLTKRRAHFRR
jgi:hypothetical protein